MTTLSDLLIEISLDHLVKAPWNYKADDFEMARKLKANITRNGQLENIVVRELPGGLYEIVNGNHRFSVMVDLGFETVTCANVGDISLEAAKRLAVELNETRFESDGQKLSELMISIVGKFGEADVLDTSPFNEAMLKTMTDPSSFVTGGGSPAGGSPFEGGRFDSPFAFTLRFTEEQLVEWMSHLKTLREAYETERNEEALLTLVRMFAPTAPGGFGGFAKVVGVIAPHVMEVLKQAEAGIADRLAEDGRSLAEDPHIRFGQIIEVLAAEYLASFGA